MNKLQSLLYQFTNYIVSFCKKIQNKILQKIAQSPQDNLMPTCISSDDPNYKIVEALRNKLDEAEELNIRNIAITGPYGSGKSSILKTLQRDYKTNRFLTISLATLRSEYVIEKEEEIEGTCKFWEPKHSGVSSEENDLKKNPTEILNRKIEYSILQQLLYKEKQCKLPSSRFSKIQYYHPISLIGISFFWILFFIACFIFLNPEGEMLLDIYSELQIIEKKQAIYISSFIIVLFGAILIISNIIRKISNFKLGKVGVYDTKLEVKNETSIFNKHLDEILYFFSATKYQYIIIEDLDRFDTSELFLKLRELNQLINESKMVKKHIVFIYAVKDDMFEDEDRTKFFDYIIPVIPIINSSNSKVKLKDALRIKGCDISKISDEALSDIALYIQDMRILHNIVNEFCQYKDSLCKSNSSLNLTNLLAMITYKNYHPKDFAELHCRKGEVYECISKKDKFQEVALTSIVEKRKELEEKREYYKNDIFKKEKELKEAFLFRLQEKTTNKYITYIYVGNQQYEYNNILNNNQIFEYVLSHDELKYYDRYSGSGQINYKDIKFDMDLKNRLYIINNPTYFDEEEQKLYNDELTIRKLRLSELIRLYNINKDSSYTNLQLSSMLDLFIRRGYIDEDYYDYISYFYEGMISISDRQYLLDIKNSKDEKYYHYHIDRIVNFVGELQQYMFENDTILNIELVDYLCEHKNDETKKESGRVCNKDRYIYIMNRICRSNVPIDFIVQYCKNGKCVETVMQNLIEWNRTFVWELINNCEEIGDQECLRIAYIKYCGDLEESERRWLNANYSFIVKSISALTIDRCQEFMEVCTFKELIVGYDEILDSVIKNCSYEINLNNLCVITSYLSKEQVTNNNLSLRRVENTENEVFIDFIKENIQQALPCFSTTIKDETEDSMLFILNSNVLTEQQKKSYLSEQSQRISHIDKIHEDYYAIAIELKLITPSWEHVSKMCDWVGMSNQVLEYIQYYIEDLCNEECSMEVANRGRIFREMSEKGLLDIEHYQKLCHSFDGESLDGYEYLPNIKSECFSVLLNDCRISFNPENTEILKNSQRYVQYMMYYINEFSKDIDEIYFNNLSEEIGTDLSIQLLSSSQLSVDEKYRIIELIDDEWISASKDLANDVVKILISVNNITIEIDTIEEYLKTATNIENKIQLITKLIPCYEDDKDEIAKLLHMIDPQYDRIVRGKYPTIENNLLNEHLIVTLEKVGYISSYKKTEHHGIIIYPKKK